VKPWCEEGQWVCIGRYSGSRFKIDGGEVRIINDDEVIATILSQRISNMSEDIAMAEEERMEEQEVELIQRRRMGGEERVVWSGRGHDLCGIW
jgi:hypothetical protein